MSESELPPTAEFRRKSAERPSGDHRGFEMVPDASFLTDLIRRASRLVYQSSLSVEESSRPNKQPAAPGATRHHAETFSARIGPLRERYSRRFRLTTTNSEGSRTPLNA